MLCLNTIKCLTPGKGGHRYENHPHWAFAAFLALVLSACGGGNSGDPLSALPKSPARGVLMESTPTRIQSVSATDFKASLSADVIMATGTPVYGVEVNYLKYATVGAMGEATDATAALMVPTGTDPRCTGPRPIVLYAHGTVPHKKYNLANNWTERTNPAFDESIFIAASFAAQGYILVAPNYAGYDSSSLSYHPYMNADQQSKDMMDALAAAKTALPKLSSPTTASSKLFITGYSQGGSVTMATHRALEAANIPVTASAPQSGVFLLLAQLDAVFLGKVSDAAPLFGTMLAISAQKSFGNLYKQPSDIFEDAYATGIESLVPGNFSYGDLINNGKLPRALFSSTAPRAWLTLRRPKVTGISIRFMRLDLDRPICSKIVCVRAMWKTPGPGQMGLWHPHPTTNFLPRPRTPFA